jgi:hypothetical protein
MENQKPSCVFRSARVWGVGHLQVPVSGIAREVAAGGGCCPVLKAKSRPSSGRGDGDAMRILEAGNKRKGESYSSVRAALYAGYQCTFGMPDKRPRDEEKREESATCSRASRTGGGANQIGVVLREDEVVVDAGAVHHIAVQHHHELRGR